MPSGLKRFHHSGQSHFVTFCCYHRRQLFVDSASRQVFESALERVRFSYRLYVYGYVVMPEHVHLLLSEPQPDDEPDGGPLKACPELVEGPGVGPGPSTRSGFRRAAQTPRNRLNFSGNPLWLRNSREHTLADALKSLKQGVSRRLLGNAEYFWQKRYYDFNVRDHAQFVEKLRYIHRNPVKAGLCERPEDWEWSSFRHYATGIEGRVEIESEWTGRKRDRAAGGLCPAVELPHSSQNQA